MDNSQPQTAEDQQIDMLTQRLRQYVKNKEATQQEEAVLKRKRAEWRKKILEDKQRSDSKEALQSRDWLQKYKFRKTSH